MDVENEGTEQMGETPDILKQVMETRVAAGHSIRVTFNEGSPDFTGHYRSIAERDQKMTAARRMPNFASVEIIKA